MVTKMSTPGSGRPLRAILLGAIFVVIISLSAVISLYVDLLWFQDVGFQSVFWRILSSQAALVGAFGLVFFVFCLGNLIVVSRSSPTYRIADEDDPLERLREAFVPLPKWILIGASALLALLFALRLAPAWELFLLSTNQVPFGIEDPVFQKDIGFYVFRLPMLQLTYQWLFSAVFVVILLVAATYYLTGGIRPQAAVDRLSAQVKVHLSVLIGLLALIRAWGYRLNQFELLYSERGTVSGASYTDITAELPALNLLVAVSIIGAILFLVNIRFRGWALPAIGLGLWVLTSILAAGVYPFLIERFRVEPAQFQREQPYLERNIEATRHAYGLDAMEVTQFPIEPGLSAETVEAGDNALANVRLWDPQTLKVAYRQLQEIRTYYQFQDVDVDRYTIGGERRQLMLALRELDTGGLESRSWLNEHLVYTHGYGSVASPTNEAESEGRPNLLLQGIPPVTDVERLEIERPGIYFGEGPGTYSVVKTEQEELDYTSEGVNQTTVYSGEAGVPVSNLFRRAALAWDFRDVNLLISSLIDSESEIIMNRQVRQRVQKVAPFLEFDGDPYPVITNGEITWMMDAYTVSGMYPYSERLDFQSFSQIRGGAAEGQPSIVGRYNYIRNSVKVTVDAYDGTVTLYVWDEEDPIIETWRNAFPDLFEDKDSMPEELREHIRYPEDMFRIQSNTYRRYHVTEPTEFYQREDEWVIPDRPEGVAASGGVGSNKLDPYYVLMRLPGSDADQYVMILPMNPRSRPNMVSLLAAKSDPAEYGELVDLRFPAGLQVFGVGQVSARINANEEISETRTLLGQGGSRVILGNLLVLPIGDSLVYSQPLFVQAESNAIPELKYVILATSEQVRMAPTVDLALEALLEGGPTVVEDPTDIGAEPSDEEEEPADPPAPPPAPASPEPEPEPEPSPEPLTGTQQELLRQAAEHFEAADEAARNGDWATYGEEQEAGRQALLEALEE